MSKRISLMFVAALALLGVVGLGSSSAQAATTISCPDGMTPGSGFSGTAFPLTPPVKAVGGSGQFSFTGTGSNCTDSGFTGTTTVTLTVDNSSLGGGNVATATYTNDMCGTGSADFTNGRVVSHGTTYYVNGHVDFTDGGPGTKMKELGGPGNILPSSVKVATTVNPTTGSGSGDVFITPSATGNNHGLGVGGSGMDDCVNTFDVKGDFEFTT